MNRNLFRDRKDYIARIFLLPLFMVFIMIFLGRLKHTQSSIQDRIGLIYQSSSVPAFMGMINSVALCECFNFNFNINNFYITKTRLYHFDPLKPHFYIVKLGFTGVYIIFFISAQNIDCGYSLELPRRGGSNEYPQSMF